MSNVVEFAEYMKRVYKIKAPISEKYNIPFYLLEEIYEYVNSCTDGESNATKWGNINTLINLAVMSERLSREESIEIKRYYCKEESYNEILESAI